MKTKSLLLILLVGLLSCNSNEQTTENIAEADTATAPQAETMVAPVGSPAVIAESNLTGSLAGLYVQSFAGANSHSYDIKFEGGAYTGKYEEYQEADYTVVPLENIIVDEANKTISFKKGADQVNAKITDEGLEASGEMYEKR